MKMIRFEIYLSPNDQLYHWRLVAANGEIVCWGEGYSSRQNALDAVNWVKRNGPMAPVR